MQLLPKKKDYFALLFTNDRVQLAQVGKKDQLRFFAGVKLKPGVIVRGEIKNQEVLKQSVSQLIKAAKTKQEFVVVGLPEVKSFSRVFTLPVLPVEEISDAARWEAEPLLPFPLDKAYLDSMILEMGDKEVRVLVVALPQEFVEGYARLLEEIGLQPVAFETTSLSLARLLQKNSVANVIIEINEKEAVLVIVGGKGGIEVSSTINFENLTEAAQEIVLTLKRLLIFYRKKVGEEDKTKKVAQVIFCGEAASENLAKKVGTEVGLPGTVLKTKNVKRAALASLAQKDVAAPVDEKTINLIPPRIQGIYDRAARAKEIGAILKIFLMTLFLICFGYSVAMAHVYFESKKVEGEMIELQAAASPEAAQLQAKVNFLNQRAKTIVAVADSQSHLMPLLGLIRQTASEGVVITRLSYDDLKGYILIDGTASRREQLLNFRQALENTNKFSHVQIPLSSLEREENVEFTLAITAQSED